MKRILFTTIVIFTSSVFINAQSDCEGFACEKQVQDVQIWTNATYTGCTNLFGKPNGFGIADFGDQQEEGCWENGKKNGRFKTVYLNDGFENYCDYENDVEQDCKSIIDNIYSENDINSGKNSFAIDLINHNNHDYIKITLGKTTDVFLYDTGASVCTMTRELFNTLPIELRGERLYRSFGEGCQITFTIGDGTYADVEFYLIKEINVQGIVIENVIFGVDIAGGSNLIGQDFWNKFSKVNPPKKGVIKVYK